MKRLALPARALRCAVAAALVCTLNPAAAFATNDTSLVNVLNAQSSEPIVYASEGANTPSNLLNETPSTINVTAPLKLFFDNSENGFDTNSNVNPTAQARFFCNAEPVRLYSITANPSTQEGKENPFETPEQLQLEVKPLNTNARNYDALTIKLNQAESQTENTTRGFIINTNTKFNFELKTHRASLRQTSKTTALKHASSETWSTPSQATMV